MQIFYTEGDENLPETVAEDDVKRSGIRDESPDTLTNRDESKREKDHIESV
jgi:hypothetical protein